MENNEQGGYDAASYLIGLGHKKIACITGPKNISSSAERTRGFKRALREHNLPCKHDFIYRGDFHYCGEKEAFLYFQSLREKPEAVFACNDMMSIGFIHTAISKGVRIPNDISIIGFDNTEISAVTSPALTTMAQPIEEIAEIATERLLKKIESKGSVVKKIILEPKLIVRETCKKSSVLRPLPLLWQCQEKERLHLSRYMRRLCLSGYAKCSI